MKSEDRLDQKRTKEREKDDESDDEKSIENQGKQGRDRVNDQATNRNAHEY